MNGLTPEARALIEEARVGEDPTTSDFDRVMHGARRRLVMAGVFALMLGAGRRAAAYAGASAKGTLVATGLITAAGVGAVASWPAPEPAAAVAPREVAQAVAPGPGESRAEDSAPSLEEEAVRAPEVAEPVDEVDAPAAKPEPVRERVVARPSEVEAAKKSDVSGAGQLRSEAALLGRAQRALSAGRLGDVRSELAEYDREHPRGVLRAEREGLEVLALCAAGHRAQARQRATRFVERYPKSPLRPRIERSCL
jgi:hypothetical protein